MYPILLTLGENIDKVFSSFDLWVFHFFGSMQCTFLTYVAKFFTTFGDEGFIIPLVVVTNGFKKELDVNGVGYRVQKQGKDLIMNLGYSHQVIVSDTEDIKIESPAPNKIIITGIDKQKVGQFAAEVRGKRPPEPYKGKGIKYTDETIRRKEGKAGKGKK